MAIENYRVLNPAMVTAVMSNKMKNLFHYKYFRPEDMEFRNESILFTNQYQYITFSPFGKADAGLDHKVI